MKSDNARWIVISILVAFVLLMATCEPIKRRIFPCPVCPEVEIITPADTIPEIEQSDIPEPEIIYRDTGSTKYRWKTIYRDTGRIDTHLIVADFFMIRTYIDTLINNESAFVVVYDSLTENRLVGRSFLFQNKRGDRLISKPKKGRIKGYYGASANYYYKDSSFSAKVTLDIIGKNQKFIFKTGLDPFRQYVEVGAAVLIGGKK